MSTDAFDVRRVLPVVAGLLATLTLLLAAPRSADSASVHLTIKLRGPNAGAVSVAPLGGVCNGAPGTECGFSIASGATVTLFANVPSASTPGTFSRGTGSAGTCATSVCTFSITASSTITATFDHSLPFESLGIMLGGDGTGNVLLGNAMCAKPSAEPASCTSMYATGSTARITPQPAAGSSFRWLPGPCSGAADCQVVLNTSPTVLGEFYASTPSRVRLAVTKSGSGGGTVTSDPPGISCGTDCTQRYREGRRVKLAARAATGSTFAGWSGAGCGTAAACTITLAADTVVIATFEKPRRFALRVARSGTGAGTVSSDPPGISCGADCIQRYPEGRRVTLTARASGDSTFAGWSRDGCGTAPTCAVTLRADTTVSATFNRPSRVTLRVAKGGTGAGTVTSDPAGIACGSDCSARYARGTPVSLAAAPAPGSLFAGWSGGGCSGTGTCRTTVNGATTVTAAFTLRDTFAFRVTTTGAGRGRVTSDPAGINCGTDCTKRYSSGTSVTLTARPSTGYVFAGWSGACTGLGRTCTVRVDARASASATFVEAVVGTTDSTGSVTLRVAGRNLRLAFVDGAPGSPIGGLAVGFALIETGVGVLLVGDPQDRFPMKIMILHGDVSGLAGGATVARLEAQAAPPASDAEDDPAPLVIRGLQFQAAVIEAITVAAQLPPPLRSFVRWSGVLGAVVNVAKLIDGAGLVPVGHDLARMGIAKRRPITREAAIEAIFTEFGAGTLEAVVVFGISAIGTAGLTLPLVAPGLAVGVIALHTATVVDLHTIMNCDDDKLSVVNAGVVSFYACDRSPGRRAVPEGLLRVNVTAPGGGPAGGSLHLISKDSLGEGFVAVLDSGGHAEIAVPIGSYKISVTSPGMSVHTGNVSVPRDGTRRNVALELDQPPARHCDECYAEYEENSARCDPFGSGSEHAECVNDALAVWEACLDTCTFFP